MKDLLADAADLIKLTIEDLRYPDTRRGAFEFIFLVFLFLISIPIGLAIVALASFEVGKFIYQLILS